MPPTDETILFAKPKLASGRYSGGPLPLAALPELSRFEEMVRAYARNVHLFENPARKRVPNYFSDRCILRLDYDEDKSPIIVRDIKRSDDFPLFPDFKNIEDEFTRSRNTLIDVISSSRANTDLPKSFPLDSIRLFQPLGKALKKGDYFEIADPSENHVGIFDNQTRKNLTERFTEKYTKPITTYGIIYALNRQKCTLGLQTDHGELITSKYPLALDLKLLNAFNDFSESRVSIEAIGSFNRFGSILNFFDISHIEILPTAKSLPSVRNQIADLKHLKPGWMNGEGLPISTDNLEFTQALLERLTAFHGIQTPYIYPSLDGGIQAEWSFKKWETSVRLDFINKLAKLHSVEVEKDIEKANQFSFGDDALEYKVANFVQSIETLAGYGL